MKNIPEIGKTYIDRHGFIVTITEVIKSGGGKSFGGNERKSKLTGFSIEMNYKGVIHKINGQEFERRGFVYIHSWMNNMYEE